MVINISNYNEYQIIKLFNRFVILRLRKFGIQILGIIDLKEKHNFGCMKTVKKVLIDSAFSKADVLCLGMGLGMTSYLNLPLNVTYVEPSKDVIEIASQFKAFDSVLNMTAEKYLSSKSKKKYDVIFYDIFIDNKVYYGALDFVKIREFLKDDGILLINTIDSKRGINNIANVNKKVLFSFPKISFLPLNAIIVINKKDLF